MLHKFINQYVRRKTRPRTKWLTSILSRRGVQYQNARPSASMLELFGGNIWEVNIPAWASSKLWKAGTLVDVSGA